MLHIPTTIDRILGETFLPDPSLLKPSNRSADIGGLEIPLYRDLLAQEALIIEATQATLNGLENKIAANLSRYDLKYPSKADEPTRKRRMIESYRTNVYLSSESREIDFNESIAGYAELVEIANRIGVSQFMNYAIVIEGVISNEFKDLVILHDDTWINLGVQGHLPIDRANAILDRKPFCTYAPAIAHTVEIDESILSCEDVKLHSTLRDPLFTIYAIIYVRTGNAGQFLAYYPIGDVQAFVEQISSETTEQPPIQQNLEVQRKSSTSGGENPPLESGMNTATKASKNAKAVK